MGFRPTSPKKSEIVRDSYMSLSPDPSQTTNAFITSEPHVNSQEPLSLSANIIDEPYQSMMLPIIYDLGDKSFLSFSITDEFPLHLPRLPHARVLQCHPRPNMPMARSTSLLWLVAMRLDNCHGATRCATKLLNYVYL
jgi:hypothetical protein